MSLAYPGGLNNFNFFTLNQNEEIATHQNSRCFRKTSFNFLRKKIIYYETVWLEWDLLSKSQRRDVEGDV